MSKTPEAFSLFQSQRRVDAALRYFRENKTLPVTVDISGTFAPQEIVATVSTSKIPKALSVLQKAEPIQIQKSTDTTLTQQPISQDSRAQ